MTAPALGSGVVGTGALADDSVSESKLTQEVRNKLDALVSVTDGREVELRSGPDELSPTHIQWRYTPTDEDTNPSWTNLVAITDLKGDPGTPGLPGTTDYNELDNKPDLKPVATSGTYSDLTDKPTLGTAAATDASDYATAAQGAKADTSVQPSQISDFETTAQLNSRDHHLAREDL